jgi:energy-converting hydrogenase Eha subunit H
MRAINSLSVEELRQTVVSGETEFVDLVLNVGEVGEAGVAATRGASKIHEAVS